MCYFLLDDGEGRVILVLLSVETAFFDSRMQQMRRLQMREGMQMHMNPPFLTDALSSLIRKELSVYETIEFPDESVFDIEFLLGTQF